MGLVAVNVGVRQDRLSEQHDPTNQPMQFLPKVGQFVLAASASFDFEKFAERELVEVENFLSTSGS